MIKKAIYPGSFDPFTSGHLDIVKKAAALFDEVYIVIGVNANKKRSFSAEKMRTAIHTLRDCRNLLAHRHQCCTPAQTEFILSYNI